MVWWEQYTYDANGNRAAKTTPWGTISYTYDAENRLIKQGDIVYTYDKDGNLLSEAGLRRKAVYEYNGQNRMTYSQVTNLVEQSQVTSRYAYDALGRRTIEQDEGSSPVRTLYDGRSFEVVRSGVMFNDGRFTTLYSEGIQRTSNSGTEGSRYRWVSEGNSEVRTRSTGEYTSVATRYTGISVTLYGNGEAVAVTRSANEGTRGGPAYLGKDLMGSVMMATNEYGTLEERYEYDAFGQPYTGDLTQGMNLGYTGKPYDATTGLYNYGYRDYKPEAARFTTIDPIRDGNNWFAYVNNDPVNWVDPWGLTASDRIISQINLNKEMNEKFVAEAMKLRGPDTYVWGGKNPAVDGGTDCSGTVEWAGEQAAQVSIRTRNANNQARDPKLTIPGDDSRGTLNYYDWNGDGKYDHVTINLGDGNELNPYGGVNNTRDNPAPIEIMPLHVLEGKETMSNRQYNWLYILE
jgi:RHS repeat-associated protein